MAAQIVEIGQKRDEIDPKLKKEEVALALHQAFTGALLLWFLRSVPTLQIAVRGSFQHFWRAIAARHSNNDDVSP
jgi:hypothetical protein